MSDNNSEPFATAGSGKSDAEVAFDLLNKLKGQGVWGERNMAAILDMYSECLDAVKGLRAYEGQDRVVSPARRGAARQPAAPVVAPVQPQPAQVAAAGRNPVQVQQQHLQQQIQQQS